VSTFTPRFHWDNCAGTDDDLSHWDGREGDAMVTCETCGRFSVAEAAEGDAQPVPAPSFQMPWLRPDAGRDGWHERHGEFWPTHRGRKRRRRHRINTRRRANEQLKS
jgi:hypothetical protein